MTINVSDFKKDKNYETEKEDDDSVQDSKNNGIACEKGGDVKKVVTFVGQAAACAPQYRNRRLSNAIPVSAKTSACLVQRKQAVRYRNRSLIPYNYR